MSVKAKRRFLEIADEKLRDRIEELLPWNVVDQLNQPTQVTTALAA